jgi:hypothetical protein
LYIKYELRDYFNAMVEKSKKTWQKGALYLIDEFGRKFQNCGVDDSAPLLRNQRRLDFKLPPGARFTVTDPALGDTLHFAYPQNPTMCVATGVVEEWWRTPPSRATGVCVIAEYAWLAKQWTAAF